MELSIDNSKITVDKLDGESNKEFSDVSNGFKLKPYLN